MPADPSSSSGIYDLARNHLILYIFVEGFQSTFFFGLGPGPIGSHTCTETATVFPIRFRRTRFRPLLALDRLPRAQSFDYPAVLEFLGCGGRYAAEDLILRTVLRAPDGALRDAASEGAAYYWKLGSAIAVQHLAMHVATAFRNQA